MAECRNPGATGQRVACCETCIFWEAWQDNDTEGDALGWCRINAPSPEANTLESLAAIWPHTGNHAGIVPWWRQCGAASAFRVFAIGAASGK